MSTKGKAKKPTGTQSINVKSILSSKNFNKPNFTKNEKAVMLSAQRKVFDKLLKQEIDILAKNTVKPWVDDFALFDKIQKANKGKGASDQLQASHVIRTLYPPEQIASCPPPLDTPQRGISPEILFEHETQSCTGVFTIEPPYDDGDPLVEVRTLNDDPLGVFDSSSALVVPAEGIISLGVGAGRFPVDETYPAPFEWFLGKYNSVEGSLIHTVLLPSSVADPTLVTVTAEFKLGVDWPYEAGRFALNPGHAGEAVGDGPVIILGNSLLTLFGDPAFNSGNANYTNFLKLWKSRSTSCYYFGECKNPRSFSSTESLMLMPGASSFTLVISARLQALLTLVPGGKLTGFAGADLLSPGLSGLWLLAGTRGGAIRVPKIRISFCRFDFPIKG